MKNIILVLFLVACGSSSTAQAPIPDVGGVHVKHDGREFLVGDGKFLMHVVMQPAISSEKTAGVVVTTITSTEPAKRYAITLGMVDSDLSTAEDLNTLEQSALVGNKITDAAWSDEKFEGWYPARRAIGTWHQGSGHLVPCVTWFMFVPKQKRVYMLTVYDGDVHISLPEATMLAERLLIL